LASVLVPRVPFGGKVGFSIPDELPNSGLRPEKTISREVGLDMRSVGDRVSLDLTYYNSETTDQILPVQVSAASGYTTRILNAGRIENNGIESVLTIVPLQLDNGLRLETQANWARNRSLVAELAGTSETIVIGDFWGINVEARKGEPYGVLYGFARERHANGQPLVNAQGLPVRAVNKSILGNYQPDFTAGLRNTISYRDFELSALVDWRQGGEMYSGVLKESLEGRAAGIVVDGVTADGQPNTMVVSAERFQHAHYQIQEYNIFDGTFVKLREVRIGFNMPKNVMGKIANFKTVRVALVGRNLWLIKTNVPNVDPETGFDSSNFQGVEYAQMPTARSWGISFSVTP
jgi:hypothetical protein